MKENSLFVIQIKVILVRPHDFLLIKTVPTCLILSTIYPEQGLVQQQWLACKMNR